MLARAVYAFNWYNVGAVLPLIGSGLDVGTAELGIVLGSFLLGAAVFQIPAGLASLRWGNRRVSLFALAAMGAFALASGLSPDWYILAATRFGAGAGAAFFFAPALGLISSYYPPGTRGPIIGLYNSGFSGGAAVGLFAGAVIGSAFGWPWALAVGGIGLFFMAAAAAVLLPIHSTPEVRRPLPEVLAAAAPVFRSRPLWALSVSMTGMWAAFYIVAQYFVKFAAEIHPGWSLAFAAALPTVMILVEIIGGPVGGWLGEHRGDMRNVLLLFGIPCGAVVILIPILPLAALIGVFAFLGFGDGVLFAAMYLIPSYRPEGQGEGLALALGLLNCIQIFAGSAVSIAFGFIVVAYGYTAAWVFAGVVGVVTLPLLAWVSGSRAPDPPRAGSGAPRPGPPE